MESYSEKIGLKSIVLFLYYIVLGLHCTLLIVDLAFTKVSITKCISPCF